MSTFSVSLAARAGADLVGAACSVGGDGFANTGQEVVVLKNGSGSAITVTFVTPSTVDGLGIADRAVVVAAGQQLALGPWQPAYYNDVNGLVQMTYSGVTSLTAMVLRVPPF